MNLNLVNLVLLQKLDDRINRLRKVEQEGPVTLAQIDEELTQAQSRVRESLDLEKDMQKRRRELENEVEDLDNKIKSNQTRQLQVKTNEEYRALLKEGDFQRKTLSSREDEILELMDKLEALAQENKDLKKWLDEQTDTLSQKRKETEEFIQVSIKDQQVLEIDRNSIVKDLPEKHMALYNRVSGHRNGRAVVAAVDGICEECHLQIPPQTYNDVIKNEALLTCPNCERILYWKDHKDFEDIQ